MLCTFCGGYCSLWPNRTARSLSRAWPSLLRAHNHIGGATAVPLHHKKCLLCSVLIYMVLGIAVSAIAIFRLVDNLNPNHLQIIHWPNYKLKLFANSNRYAGNSMFYMSPLLSTDAPVISCTETLISFTHQKNVNITCEVQAEPRPDRLYLYYYRLHTNTTVELELGASNGQYRAELHDSLVGSLNHFCRYKRCFMTVKTSLQSDLPVALIFVCEKHKIILVHLRFFGGGKCSESFEKYPCERF